MSAAARALGLAQPTLSRQVAALEKELGLTLFERHGRGLELTPMGQRLLEPLKAMSNAATEVSLLSAGYQGDIEGRVCLSVTDSIGEFMLPPILHELKQRYPGITIEIIATNSLSDLRRREADIALRAIQPTEGDLIARKLKTVNAYLYGTPSYLRLLGVGRSAKELAKADFIGFSENKQIIELFAESGLEINESNFAAISDSHSMHWQMVKAGLGIGIMLESIGDADPEVVRACDDFKPYVGELWLVAHKELRSNRRIKVVYDFLYEALS